MSSMLEQAIVDAEALKEAAIKNAEQEILEKYSQDIKEAVNSLLEQTEDLEDEDLMMDPDLGAPEEVDPVLDEIPPAATAGENLCPCPEDEEVTINLDSLIQQASEEQPLASELREREEIAEEIVDEQDVRKLDEEELDEEIELSEQDLSELAEELKFDYEPTPSGWMSGKSSGDIEQDQLIRKVQREIEEANKDKEKLKENLDSLNKQNQKFKRIILQLKDRLDEVSVSHARLLYTNRVLENPSLNERQKTKIVETISKAQTIEKAKMIYEALQSAVDGTISKREKPESLNEVVSRPSTMVFSARREERQQSDHVLTRMQRLAGIKKS